MALFRRRKPEGPDTSEWRGPLDPAGAERLLGLVEADLRRDGLEVHMDPQAGSASTEGRTYGLGNLAQTCAHEEAGDWPRVVSEHFDRLRRSLEEQALPATLDPETRAQLRVRLQDPAFFEGSVERGDPMALRPVAPGLVEVLVLDRPETVHYVHRGHVEDWGEEVERLLEEAGEALRASPPEHAIDVHRMGGEGDEPLLLAAFSDDFYTATRALWLDELLQERLPAAGALVAVPTRNAVLAHPLEDASAVVAVQRLLELALRLHAEGPGSISDQLFWWRPDEPWMLLPSRREGDRLVFEPPEDFVEMLNDLVDG